MTAVKGFNEISYDELMDVNGGGTFELDWDAIGIYVYLASTPGANNIVKIWGATWEWQTPEGYR